MRNSQGCFACNRSTAGASGEAPRIAPDMAIWLMLAKRRAQYRPGELRIMPIPGSPSILVDVARDDVPRQSLGMQRTLRVNECARQRQNRDGCRPRLLHARTERSRQTEVESREEHQERND